MPTPYTRPPFSNTAPKASPPAGLDTTPTPTPYRKFITDIFDTLDTDKAYILPIELIPGIRDKDSALSAIQAAISGLTEEQRKTDTGADLLSLYVEEAVARAACTAVSDDVVIEKSHVVMLQRNSRDVLIAAEKMLAQYGVPSNRVLQADVTYFTNKSKSLKISFSDSSDTINNGNVRVISPEYTVSFSKRFIDANTYGQPLAIKMTDRTDLHKFKEYDLTFSRPINMGVKLSVPQIQGELKYQAVFDASGAVIGGKYNPITTFLEAKINNNGTYYVKNNKKDFKDIINKSAEMRNAITILASKGIMNGTSEAGFSPDQAVSRADISGILTRALLIYNPNEDSPFTDISISDWFYGAVGSAYKHKLMSGTSPTTFSPNADTIKGQTASVMARVLRIFMQYKDPPDIDAILSVYQDAEGFADWMRKDIALDTRENLFVKRADGLFAPLGVMSRGDMAIVLYRLFVKIW